jgi:hypothetical protein
MPITNLSAQLRRDEDEKQFAYDDATGKTLLKGDTLRGNLSIGVGHNLTANGLSQKARDFILADDEAIASAACPAGANTTLTCETPTVATSTAVGAVDAYGIHSANMNAAGTAINIAGWGTSGQGCSGCDELFWTPSTGLITVITTANQNGHGAVGYTWFGFAVNPNYFMWNFPAGFADPTCSNSADCYLLFQLSCTSSPASVQTTGGTGTAFTNIFCQLTTEPEYMCAWLVKSSNASNTAVTCTTCGTMNALWAWEISGTNTTTPIDKIVPCISGLSVTCTQPNSSLTFHNGYNAEAVISAWEATGSCTSFTNTGFTGTSNGFPNGNAGEDGILSSNTTITVSPQSCGGTPAGIIIGIQGSGATLSCVGTADLALFADSTDIASGNPTVSANLVNLGDPVVVMPWCLNGTSCTLTSVTVGSQTATQTSVAGGSGSTAGQPYFYYVLSSTQTGSVTITENISGAYTNAQVAYVEFAIPAGCTAAHDVDSASGSSSTGATITSPSITPSGANEILVAFTAVESHGTGQTSPWTCTNYIASGSEHNNCTMIASFNQWGYILNGASGATANAAAQISSDPWQAILTSFSLSASAGAVARHRAWVIQ